MQDRDRGWLRRCLRALDLPVQIPVCDVLNERYYYSSMRLMQCGDIVDAGANLERRGKGRHQTRLDYLGPIKLR